MKRYLTHAVVWVLVLSALVALFSVRSPLPSEHQLQVLTAPLVAVQAAPRSTPSYLGLRMDMGEPQRRMGLLTIDQGLKARLKPDAMLTVRWANWHGNAVIWSVADAGGPLRSFEETQTLVEQFRADQTRTAHLIAVLVGLLAALRSALD